MMRLGVAILGVATLVAGLVVAAPLVPATAASSSSAVAARSSPAPATGDSASPQVHVVRTGETLWAIARQHGLRPEVLARANGLADPDRLRVGDRIVLPWAGTEPAPRGAGRPRRPTLDWPSRGVVTSRFGLRGKRHHHGIDIAAPVGSPIRATRDGVVQSTGWQGDYGRLVILDHGDGLTTWYGHASKILVRVGQPISKGEVIALVGTSGRVTGPNVHFEVRRNNVPLDPWPFLTGRRI